MAITNFNNIQPGRANSLSHAGHQGGARQPYKGPFWIYLDYDCPVHQQQILRVVKKKNLND